jgi:hypothetical protein
LFLFALLEPNIELIAKRAGEDINRFMGLVMSEDYDASKAGTAAAARKRVCILTFLSFF